MLADVIWFSRSHFTAALAATRTASALTFLGSPTDTFKTPEAESRCLEEESTGRL